MGEWARTFEKPPISFSHSVEQLHKYHAYPLKYSTIYLHKNVNFTKLWSFLQKIYQFQVQWGTPAEDPQLSQCLGGVSKSPLPSSPTPQIQTTSIFNGVTTSISNGVTTRIKRRSHSEQKVKLNQLESIILKVLISDLMLSSNKTISKLTKCSKHRLVDQLRL